MSRGFQTSLLPARIMMWPNHINWLLSKQRSKGSTLRPLQMYTLCVASNRYSWDETHFVGSSFKLLVFMARFFFWHYSKRMAIGEGITLNGTLKTTYCLSSFTTIFLQPLHCKWCHNKKKVSSPLSSYHTEERGHKSIPLVSWLLSNARSEQALTVKKTKQNCFNAVLIYTAQNHNKSQLMTLYREPVPTKLLVYLVIN